MPSSIFSFDSFRKFEPCVPTTLLAVLAILGLMEMGVRSVSEERFASAGGWLGELPFVEREILPKGAKPRYVFFGSSRTAAAVMPTLMEKELGAEAGVVANLALRGGRFNEAIQLYRQNREVLRRAKTMFLGIDGWYLSTSPQGFTPRFRLNCRFGERLGIASGKLLRPEHTKTGGSLAERTRRSQAALENLREKLIYDGLFTMRIKSRYLGRALSEIFGQKSKNQLHLDPFRRVFVNGVPERGEPTVDPKVMRFLAEKYYRDFTVHPLFSERLRELARLAAEDGVELVLFQLPNRRQFYELIAADYSAEYELHTRTLEALAKELGLTLLQWRRPKECGLEESDYQNDFGHLADQGARKFSRFFGKLIRRRWSKQSRSGG